MTERRQVVERYANPSLVTITAAECCCCCWSLGTTRESGDGRWTLRETNRNHNYRWTTMKQREGVRGQARPSQRPWGTPTRVAHYVFFYCFYFLTRRRNDPRKREPNIHLSLVLIFFSFYSWFAGMRLQQATVHFGREIEDDKKHESSTVWVRSESYHANRDHRTLAAAGGKWLLCEGLRSTPDQCWIWFFVWKLMAENLAGKKW